MIEFVGLFLCVPYATILFALGLREIVRRLRSDRRLRRLRDMVRAENLAAVNRAEDEIDRRWDRAVKLADEQDHWVK